MVRRLGTLFNQAIKYVLQSNLTFSRLIEKLYVPAAGSSVVRILVEKSIGGTSVCRYRTKVEVKALGDIFETVIAVFYVNRGFESLHEWARDIFKPLIYVAKQAYFDVKNGEHAERRRPAVRSRAFSNPTQYSVQGEKGNIPLFQYGPHHRATTSSGSEVSQTHPSKPPYGIENPNIVDRNGIMATPQQESSHTTCHDDAQYPPRTKPVVFIDLTLEDDDPPVSHASSHIPGCFASVNLTDVEDDSRSEVEVCDLLGVL